MKSSFSFYLKAPVESTDLDRFLIEMDLQSVFIDDVYDGTHNGRRIARDSIQQGLQPSFFVFTEDVLKESHPSMGH